MCPTRNSIFTFEDRSSDSPFIERVWRAQSDIAGPFLSIAMSHWEMVVTKGFGGTLLTLRGPESKVTSLHCPAGGEWIGIRFPVGTVMPHLPASGLVDESINLPHAGARAFWLHGSAWQFPNFENAETFVARLVRKGLLTRDRVVNDARQRQFDGVSVRSAQRHFVRTTGLTQDTIRQIDRARYATVLLQNGMSTAQVVSDAGYYDQPHLCRSLKRFIGQTPVQIAARAEPLSLLYKTPRPSLASVEP
jgi:AraC-like DNA-binding protein